jgi:hypothetical protein
MKAITAFVVRYGNEWEAKTGKKIGKISGCVYGWANY